MLFLLSFFSRGGGRKGEEESPTFLSRGKKRRENWKNQRNSPFSFPALNQQILEQPEWAQSNLANWKILKSFSRNQDFHLTPKAQKNYSRTKKSYWLSRFDCICKKKIFGNCWSSTEHTQTTKSHQQGENEKKEKSRKAQQNMGNEEEQYRYFFFHFQQFPIICRPACYNLTWQRRRRRREKWEEEEVSIFGVIIMSCWESSHPLLIRWKQSKVFLLLLLHHTHTRTHVPCSREPTNIQHVAVQPWSARKRS